MLDGSGSLVSNSNGTDNDGLRYEAIQLFLALLSDQGNEVSAIVFDDDSENYLLNTDVEQVSGKEEKLDLSQKIKDAGTGGDTDIGSALLTAVERLEAVNNDNESIFWFIASMVFAVLRSMVVFIVGFLQIFAKKKDPVGSYVQKVYQRSFCRCCLRCH